MQSHNLYETKPSAYRKGHSTETALQLYIYMLQHTRYSMCIAKLVKCMDEIEKWMVVNKLQLNGEKTDFVITGSTSLLKKLKISTIKVGDLTVRQALV